MKAKNWFIRLLSGIGIGIGAAIPGVSGGTIAVILKVYENIISAINNIFKKFKESILILIPVLLGVLIALIPCIILMNKALNNLLFAVVTLFAGFIIGSFPGIAKEVKGQKPNKAAIIALIVCFLIVLAIGITSFFVGDKVDLSTQISSPKVWMFFLMIPVGVLASSALVVPGISGSMLMLILGFYKPLVDGATNFIKNLFGGKFSDLNWPFFGVLACFAVGVIIGFFLISKLMKYLLTKHRLTTYYGIMGFIVASVITLYINYDIGKYYQTWGSLKWYVEVIIAVFMLLIGIAIAYFLLKLQRNAENAKEDEVKQE